MTDAARYLEIYKEQMTYARHHEDLRERSTSIILAVAGVIVALSGDIGDGFDLPGNAALFLMLLGVLGYCLNIKHYFKFKEHYDQAQVYLRAIVPKGEVKNAAKKARNEARNADPIGESAAIELELNVLWKLCNVMIVLLGLAFLIL